MNKYQGIRKTMTIFMLKLLFIKCPQFYYTVNFLKINKCKRKQDKSINLADTTYFIDNIIRKMINN